MASWQELLKDDQVLTSTTQIISTTRNTRDNVARYQTQSALPTCLPSHTENYMSVLAITHYMANTAISKLYQIY